jgi:hypothetical protein
MNFLQPEDAIIPKTKKLTHAAHDISALIMNTLSSGQRLIQIMTSQENKLSGNDSQQAVKMSLMTKGASGRLIYAYDVFSDFISNLYSMKSALDKSPAEASADISDIERAIEYSYVPLQKAALIQIAAMKYTNYGFEDADIEKQVSLIDLLMKKHNLLNKGLEGFAIPMPISNKCGFYMDKKTHYCKKIENYLFKRERLGYDNSAIKLLHQYYYWLGLAQRSCLNSCYNGGPLYEAVSEDGKILYFKSACCSDQSCYISIEYAQEALLEVRSMFYKLSANLRAVYNVMNENTAMKRIIMWLKWADDNNDKYPTWKARNRPQIDIYPNKRENMADIVNMVNMTYRVGEETGEGLIEEVGALCVANDGIEAGLEKAGYIVDNKKARERATKDFMLSILLRRMVSNIDVRNDAELLKVIEWLQQISKERLTKWEIGQNIAVIVESQKEKGEWKQKAVENLGSINIALFKRPVISINASLLEFHWKIEEQGKEELWYRLAIEE